VTQPSGDESRITSISVVIAVRPSRMTSACSSSTSSKRAGARKSMLALATTASTPRVTISCHGPTPARQSSVKATSKYIR
jgi:hypothetical protein